MKRVISLATAAALTCAASPALAQTLQASSVLSVGCSDGAFQWIMDAAGMTGVEGIRTQVFVGPDQYMNQEIVGVSNGTYGWGAIDAFSYGPVASQGTWPIPAGQTMTTLWTVEHPKGTVLSSWEMVVDGCDTGVVLSNGVPGGAPPAVVPTLTEWAMILLGGLMATAAALTIARRRTA